MLLQCVTDMRRVVMESLHVYKNSAFKEIKYAENTSAILMAEYTRDGYFQVEDNDVVLTAERQAALEYAMSKLRPRERYIIDRFANAKPGEPWLSELAEAMDVHELRIKQIRDKALWKLRFYLRKEKKVSLWVKEEEV